MMMMQSLFVPCQQKPPPTQIILFHIFDCAIRSYTGSNAFDTLVNWNENLELGVEFSVFVHKRTLVSDTVQCVHFTLWAP